jgi:hypothetical protein
VDISVLRPLSFLVILIITRHPESASCIYDAILPSPSIRLVILCVSNPATLNGLVRHAPVSGWDTVLNCAPTKQWRPLRIYLL